MQPIRSRPRTPLPVRAFAPPAAMLLLLLAAACQLRTSAVPEPADPQPAPDLPPVPPPDASAVSVPDGYRVEVAVRDLTYPTSAEVDAEGRLYVAEAGYAYGDHHEQARVLRISADGTVEVLAENGLHGPVNDLLWHDGRLFVSHRGRISRIADDGTVVDLVTDLPSGGDHQNNQLAVGPDQRLYFGQGTVTNSGVVGVDSFVFGWLPLRPQLHDRPAQDIRLAGATFTTMNPWILSRGEDDAMLSTTAAFHPFGTEGEDERVPGTTKASGTILSCGLSGEDLQVHAWGLRNPFGVCWVEDRLYASENGFDARGSRPIANDREDLYLIERGRWYGWPDYAGGVPVTDERFAPPDGPAPEFLMAEHPPVEKPLMQFPQHSAVAKLAASPGDTFGSRGTLFLASFGAMTPLTGKAGEHGGHQVLRIDPERRAAEPFCQSARDGGAAGAVEAPGAGLRRPIDVVFARDGNTMYVVDFGAFVVLPTEIPMPKPMPGTGVVWRITADDAPASTLQAVSVAPPRAAGTAEAATPPPDAGGR